MGEMFLIIGVVILVIQMVMFAIAYWQQTDKLTDISYGLSFVLVAAVAKWWFGFNGWLSNIGFLLVVVWGVRIAGYLFVRILKMKRDRRFDQMRENLIRFGGFWLLQAVTIWVVILPAIVLIESRVNQLGLVSLVGIGISILGLGIETIADIQKYQFKSKATNKDKFANVGLWKFSRHPNYFGEMMFWWGLFGVALASDSGWRWVSIVSPVMISWLLLKVSGIPPLEKRYREKYGQSKEYQEYLAKTRLLVPIPKFS